MGRLRTIAKFAPSGHYGVMEPLDPEVANARIPGGGRRRWAFRPNRPDEADVAETTKESKMSKTWKISGLYGVTLAERDVRIRAAFALRAATLPLCPPSSTMSLSARLARKGA